MQNVNLWLIFLSALIPMVVGAIWYNPKVFGTAWMKASGLTQEQVEGGNMPLIFGLSFVMSCLLAFFLSFFVHHDMSVANILFEQDPKVPMDSEFGLMIQDHLNKLAERYNTFGHGVAHGLLIAAFFFLPILVTRSLFERKGFKYILVNFGYWALTLALMGGVLSKWFVN